MTYVYAATLFQRPELEEKVSTTPTLFLSASIENLVERIRNHIDQEFDLGGSADDRALAEYAKAHEFDQLERWFDDHYCFFKLQLHEQEI
jgi:hypothetical protein